jgi:hypothetical protein
MAHSAYQAVAESLPVSLTSVYNKVNGTEPAVAAALVKHSAQRLGPVITQMGGQALDILAGYRVRIIDGNHVNYRVTTRYPAPTHEGARRHGSAFRLPSRWYVQHSSNAC